MPRVSLLAGEPVVTNEAGDWAPNPRSEVAASPPELVYRFVADGRMTALSQSSVLRQRHVEEAGEDAQGDDESTDVEGSAASSRTWSASPRRC